MAIETYFQNIANAIREKTGSSGLITPAQMPGEIAGIETGIETISETEWNALSMAEKRTFGITGIIQRDNGYKRGIVVNGADYFPDPVLTHSSFMNAASSDVLTYTFARNSNYLILIALVQTENLSINNVSVKLNNESINSLFTQREHGIISSLPLYMYTLQRNFSVDDVLSLNVVTSVENSGIQMFVIEYGITEDFDVIDARINGGGTFLIPNSNRYVLQVSKFGYYAGGNTIPDVELKQYPSGGTSIECPSSIWYGGTYAAYVN